MVRGCFLRAKLLRVRPSREAGDMLGVASAAVFSSPGVKEPTSAELPRLWKHPGSGQGCQGTHLRGPFFCVFRACFL